MVNLNTITERLAKLPDSILRTFHSDFIFLIYSDKIQHLPVRNQTDVEKQKIARAYFKQSSIQSKKWADHLVYYSEKTDLIVLLPHMSN